MASHLLVRVLVRVHVPGYRLPCGWEVRSTSGTISCPMARACEMLELCMRLSRMSETMLVVFRFVRNEIMRDTRGVVPRHCRRVFSTVLWGSLGSSFAGGGTTSHQILDSIFSHVPLEGCNSIRTTRLVQHCRRSLPTGVEQDTRPLEPAFRILSSSGDLSWWNQSNR
jgi:hypothetical protein